MIWQLKISAYVTESNEMVKEGYVHVDKKEAFFVPNGRDGISIVREMLQKHNYLELAAEEKITRVKKVHIGEVVVSEKGIESIWKIKQQIHVPNLVECLNEIKSKGKLASSDSKQFLGANNAFVGPNHPMYIAGVEELLRSFKYRLETPAQMAEEEIAEYNIAIKQGKVTFL